MITFLMYSHLQKELKIFRKSGLDVTCMISEDDWDFLEYSDKMRIIKFLEDNPVIDISLIDTSADSGIEVAEKLRSSNKGMYIILIADIGVSPMTYIKPSIMAGSLLIRPLSNENIKQVFMEAFSEYLKNFRSENAEEDNFVIDTREGRQLVPYQQIIFFESRDKKIFINTGRTEYSVYDTLDAIEDRLGDDFIRCHRSYIIKKSMIKKIFFSQNTIELSDGEYIPLSRTYKSSLKELK